MSQVAEAGQLDDDVLDGCGPLTYAILDTQSRALGEAGKRGWGKQLAALPCLKTPMAAHTGKANPCQHS